MILDVTQMSGDAVCVAGIDLANDETVRLAGPQPTQRLLAALGGVDPGDIVKVEAKPLRKLEAPHAEDCEWNPRSFRRVGVASLADMQAAIAPGAFSSVQAAFGEPVTRGTFGNSSWSPASGTRSLATISVLYVRATSDRNERARIAFKDESLEYWQAVPLQDLRVKMHHLNCGDCEGTAHVDQLQQEFDVNRCLIRVGLTRPFSPNEGTEPMCWLQVTNILGKEREHFVDLPPRRTQQRAPRPLELATA